MNRFDGTALLAQLIEAQKSLMQIEQENRQTFENFMLMVGQNHDKLSDEERKLISELKSLRHKRWSLYLRDVAELLEDL